MLKKLLVISAFALTLQACGTVAFNPPVHALAAHKIQDFEVTGTVKIDNEQVSDTPVILHSYGGTKLQSNYKEVTNTMVSQANAELERHGKSNNQGAEKRIGLKVTHLHSNYIAFFWKGSMTYTVTLGESESFDLTVNHSTGMNAQQNLSGAIADGVVALFHDNRVQAYLKK